MTSICDPYKNFLSVGVSTVIPKGSLKNVSFEKICYDKENPTKLLDTVSALR